MNRLIDKFAKDIVGHLSGFDRLVFKGTLRNLAVRDLFESFLAHRRVLLKDFSPYVQRVSRQLKEASFAEAEKRNRPVRYLPSSQIPKAEQAKRIARQDGISEGLICVLHTVELCRSYKICRDPLQKHLVLQSAPRKCTHVYHYWIHPVFGFMSARIQAWFPFEIHVWLNGREWLAQQMKVREMGFKRRENCLVSIDDPEAAQKLMNQQLKTNWVSVLDNIAGKLNPVHDEMLGPRAPKYYWTAYQTEWALDLMFRSAADLAAVYPALTRGSIAIFGAKDVMRFLGQPPHWHLQGEVTSSFKDRQEGIRVKHHVKINSVKVYDKFGSVLRIETTVKDPRAFRVSRTKTNDPTGPKSRQYIRRSVADLYHRAMASQAVNNRYADALASIETDEDLATLLSPACHPATRGKRRYRGLKPFSAHDLALLRIVSRGEFTISGFCNRDLRNELFPAKTTRDSARVTRLLALLRAHGLIRRLPKRYRYVLSTRGRRIVSAILAIQSSQTKTLLSQAA